MNYLLLLLSSLVLVFSQSSPALAHFLKTDREIGAVLHIQPSDDPVAGENISVFFDLKDKSGRFTPVSCTCVATLTVEGKEISSVAATPNSSGVIANYYFPDPGIYQVVLTGKASQGATFQPFTLTWEVRVERSVKTKASASPSFLSTHFSHLLLILGAIIYLGYRLRLDKQKDQERAKKKS